MKAWLFPKSPNAADNHSGSDRQPMALWIIRAGIVGAVATVLVNVGLFLKTGAWQMMFICLSETLVIVCLIITHRLAQQGRLDTAGYGMIGCAALAFGIIELVHAGVTPYITIGGVLLLLVVGMTTLPHKPAIWLITTLLFIAYIGLVNQLPLFPRYDMTQLAESNILTLAIVGFLLLVIFWRALHTYQHIHTIRVQLIVAFVSVALLPVLIIVMSIFMGVSQGWQRQTINQLNLVAALKETEINAWTDSLLEGLAPALSRYEAISLLQGSGALDPQTAYSFIQYNLIRYFLSQVKEQKDRFEELSLLNLDGNVVVSTDNALVGSNFRRERYFQEGLKQPYVQLLPAQTPGEPLSAVVALPITDDQGKVWGILAGRTNAPRLNEAINQRIGLGETGRLYLVDTDYKRLTGVHPGERTEVHSEGTKAAISQQTNGASLYRNAEGIAVVGAYRWLPAFQAAMLVEQTQDEAFRTLNQMIQATLLAALLATAVAVVIAMISIRSVVTPLSHLGKTAAQIAAGHLELTARIEQENEIGALARAFNHMTEQLRQVINDLKQRMATEQATVQQYVDYMAKVRQGNLASRLVIPEQEYRPDDPLVILGQSLNEATAGLQQMIVRTREAVHALNTAAAEILQATKQQATEATKQSAAIAQASATVSEVWTIVEQSTMRSEEVVKASQRTVKVSQSGRQAVQDAIESMAQIQEHVAEIADNTAILAEQTQQIGEIIATVNSLAAQSNILALNAAVEAARAGEHGRGFAVVAAEVRSLAEQSRQATAQIGTILSEIQKATQVTVQATEEGNRRVNQGAQLATQAGQTIAQLAGVINESTETATQLIADARQQMSGIEQIALAMQNIKQATAQSLASTRQAEKAAQDLNELARRLTETVQQYQL